MRISTVIKKAKALEAIKMNYGRVRPALKSAGIGKSQFYQWRADDSEFEKNYLATLQKCKAQLTSKLAMKLKTEKPEVYTRLLRDIIKKQRTKNNKQNSNKIF
jgi:hypothetical protein